MRWELGVNVYSLFSQITQEFCAKFDEAFIGMLHHSLINKQV